MTKKDTRKIIKLSPELHKKLKVTASKRGTTIISYLQELHDHKCPK